MPFSPEVQSLLKRIYSRDNSSFDMERGCSVYSVPDDVTAEEIQCLANADCLPNQFVRIAHDDAIARLQKVSATIDLRKAANAFVASLTSQTLAWRTVLPALALGLAVQPHTADGRMHGGACSICFHRNEERDATDFAHSRFVQGAGWDDTLYGPVGSLLALEAASNAREWPEPTERDIWVFHQILDVLRALPAANRYGKARDAIRVAKLLPDNNPYVVGTLLEALAVIGILANADHPGLFTRFTTASERDQRPSVRCEAPGPLAWWSAADGVNEALVARLFGHLSCPKSEPPVPPKGKKVAKARPKGPLVKAIPGEVAAGDVYAVRVGDDLWGAVYCHEVKTSPLNVVFGRIEWLDILSSEPPTAEQIAATTFKDLDDGRWQIWCSSLGKVTSVKRVAIGVPAMSHPEPVPERIVGDNAKSLPHIARLFFSELQA